MSSGTCCIFFDRRTGCIILGAFSLISNLSDTIKEITGERDWYDITSSMIFVVAAILLLVGVFQARHSLFTPYLIIQGVGIFLKFIIFIIILFVVIKNGQLKEKWIDGVAEFILLAVGIYFFYVVYNHYNDITNRLPR